MAWHAKQHEMVMRDGHSVKRYQLDKVCFSTSKPSIIRVDAGRDGANCKKVVGGPWDFEVERGSLKIRIATTNACFGYQLSADKRHSTIWAHPHTQSFSVALNGTWRNFSEVSNTCKLCRECFFVLTQY